MEDKKTNRSCDLVILDILKEIPNSKKRLIVSLRECHKMAIWSAPEDMSAWHETYKTLLKHIDPFKTFTRVDSWEFSVWSIFTMRNKKELLGYLSYHLL